jgi:hypothetical protein
LEEVKEEWYISTDEENYGDGPYDTKEEAIAEGKAGYNDGVFWVGQKTGCLFNISATTILEHIEEWLAEQAYEQVGDHAEDWPPNNKLVDRFLEDEIIAFLKTFIPKLLKRKPPNFFALTNVEQVENTE